MPSPSSTWGEFELVEALQPPSQSAGSSSRVFEPQYWHPYPFEKDEDLAERPWSRPEQIQMSFVGVNVIDVEQGRIMESMTVKTSKGLILSIERMKSVDMQESGWTSVDCEGLFMCPGLIDCES
jgi:hypothetical protein